MNKITFKKCKKNFEGYPHNTWLLYINGKKYPDTYVVYIADADYNTPEDEKDDLTFYSAIYRRRYIHFTSHSLLETKRALVEYFNEEAAKTKANNLQKRYKSI